MGSPFKMSGKTLPKYMDNAQANIYFESLSGVDSRFMFDLKTLAEKVVHQQGCENYLDVVNSEQIVKAIAGTIGSFIKRIETLSKEVISEYESDKKNYEADDKKKFSFD